MYIPRDHTAALYTRLLASTTPSSAPLLILTSLTVDSLCAVRILTALLRRDFIAHNVVPVSGYAALQDAGERQVQKLRRDRGGDGGTVVCVGCGGGVDLSEVLLGLGEQEDEEGLGGDGHGVEVWVLDARRPWSLENVFGNAVAGLRGADQGKLLPSHRPGKGGIIVWDAGDIQTEMEREREAYVGLREMPEITEDDLALETAPRGDDDAGAGAAVEEDGDDEEPSSRQENSRKRKASAQFADTEDEADDEGDRPRQRRRSSRSTPIPSSPGGRPHSFQLPARSPSPAQSHAPAAAVPSSPPVMKPLSMREQKKQLLKLRRKHEATLEKYYDAGAWTGEPVASMMYSLASDLGREDNELLWLAIVGVESVYHSPFSASPAPKGPDGRKGTTGMDLVKSILHDEVRRLNPPVIENHRTQQSDTDAIPTHARSPTDDSIRLSPEPRFLLVRHWSLYDSMMHSTYLATRLHVWSEQGRKRLHKLLAKMGISLAEAGKGFLHLDMEIKETLNKRLNKFAEQYNLEGLVPSSDRYQAPGKVDWGFVRSWGWRGTLSAVDVVTIVSAILEVGAEGSGFDLALGRWDPSKRETYHSRLVQRPSLPSPPHSSDSGLDEQTVTTNDAPDWTTRRFYAAYDALAPATSKSAHSGLATLLTHIPTAQSLARAILRTGSALIAKKQIRHLRSFRMGVVKEGPDVPIFTHPGALVKLAAWVSEAVGVLEAEKGVKTRKGEDDALVLGALDEGRSLYVVVGLGGGGVGTAGRVRTKAEIKEREEKKKRKEAEKKAKKAERARKKEARRQLRRERLAANGDLSASEDSGNESDATESSASSSSSSSDPEDSADEDAEDGLQRRKKLRGKNRFGQAFQEVVQDTNARVRIDSFEHSVVEVKKEDLVGFLEALSSKAVVS
jgi:cell division control protein 45